MAYVINNMTVHDKARYKLYLSEFMATFQPFGGQVLAAQNAPKPVEGTWPYDRTILLALPSRDAFNPWVNSEAYKGRPIASRMQRLSMLRHLGTVSPKSKASVRHARRSGGNKIS